MLDGLDELYTQITSEYPIDVNRVYLSGFSMGSFGTWCWALEHPDRFAALFPVGGHGFDHRMWVMSNDLSPLKDVPIWMVHSRLDQSVPVAGADEVAQALSNLEAHSGYTRYPDASHGGTSERAFADMTIYRWLLEQSRSNP